MKKIVAAACVAFSSFSTWAQVKVADVFQQMPDSVQFVLTEENRKDLVDYFIRDMAARVMNRFEEFSSLDEMTDSYLCVAESAKSRFVLKLLETTDGKQVIAAIRTVSASASDSQVKFYDTSWRRLYWLDFPQPSVSDFFEVAPDSLVDEVRAAQRALQDLRLVEVKVSASEPIFELVLQTSELARQEKKTAQSFVHPLYYRWTGEEFRLVSTPE